MIYLDNAATTLKKPPQVIQAVVHAMETMGNCARGSHQSSRNAARGIYEEIRDFPQVKLYGSFAGEHCPIVSLNIGSWDSGAVADALAEDFGIATRSGAHCAPLMHEALETCAQGAVRFSFSCFNTVEEVDAAIEAVKCLCEEASQEASSETVGEK